MTKIQTSMRGSLSLRSNWSSNHMRAALRAALAAHEVERSNDVKHHGPWFDDMMMHVPVAIIMAAAALEANCHEIIQDILDQSGGTRYCQGHTALFKLILRERSGNSLNKYRKVAWLHNRKVREGAPAWQKSRLLFDLRNHFMHFRSAWDTEKAIHDGKLVKSLKTRLQVAPSFESDFLFPYGFMTYECAEWAIETAWDFAAEFSTLTGLADKLAPTRIDMPAQQIRTKHTGATRGG
jgi:hypothetical protein